MSGILKIAVILLAILMVATPLFFTFISSEIKFFGANLKPFGKIKIPPTFKSAF